MLILGLTGVTAYHAFQNIGMTMTSASESSIIIAVINSLEIDGLI
jgi:NADPH-dependent curcumin reductase CurA